jgi:hypothetical protein
MASSATSIRLLRTRSRFRTCLRSLSTVRAICRRCRASLRITRRRSCATSISAEHSRQLCTTHAPVGLYLGTAYRLADRSGGLAWPAEPQRQIQCRCSLDTTLPSMQPSALPSSSRSFSGNSENGLHVVMQDGLQAPAVPVEGDPGPINIGDRGLVALVIAPTDAIAGF